MSDYMGNEILMNITGWWLVRLPLWKKKKWWSSSVRIMTFPIWWESHKIPYINHIFMINHHKIPWFQTTNQYIIIMSKNVIQVSVVHHLIYVSPWNMGNGFEWILNYNIWTWKYGILLYYIHSYGIISHGYNIYIYILYIYIYIMFPYNISCGIAWIPWNLGTTSIFWSWKASKKRSSVAGNPAKLNGRFLHGNADG